MYSNSRKDDEIMNDRDLRIKLQQSKQNESNRCTGHCCEAFIISRDQAIRELALSEDKEEIIELSKILNLSIHVSGEYHTCKYFNDKTRNCDNYLERPKMCKEYPYGRNCDFSDCTWKSVRLPYTVREEYNPKISKVVKFRRIVKLLVLDCDYLDTKDYLDAKKESLEKVREKAAEMRKAIRKELNICQ